MKRIAGLALTLALLTLTLLSPRSPLPKGIAQGPGFDRAQMPFETPQGELGGAELLPESGPVDVMIELSDLPTTKIYLKELGDYGTKGRGVQKAPGQLKERAKAAARGHASRVDQVQKNLVARLAGPDIKAKVLFRVQTAYNGVAAKIDARAAGAIMALEGVKGVYPLPQHTIDNSTSVPFIKAVNAWVASGGNAGDGVSIGIIDTGIDYTHADFGGPGNAASYSTNNRTVVEAGTFPTAKVVGGRDFAGDAYTGANAPVPDNDPLDCNGHGTHVAGSAAGTGVKSDGTAYAGPYDATTNFSTLSIGPGVAPKASLYALKVFGCTGSTNLTTQAINWAVDPNGDGDPSDHLDVINMSLGSNFGTATDASAAASNNAAAIGVIVAAASGNAGDTTYITSSPASATRAISVANTVDGGQLGAGLRVNSPPALAGNRGALPAQFNPPFALPFALTGNVVLGLDPNNAAGPSTTDACSPLTNAAAVAGQIALVDRGSCDFVVKVKNAQNAGATGVIVANNAAGTISMGGADPTIVIPSLSITLADANPIKAQLAGGVNATLQLFSLGDTVSGSSSRGPRRNGAALKPEISAPGSNITSAGFSTGNGPLTISGTSMATPHVAGALAVLRQLHPAWSVEELKALVMNTANHDLFTGNSGTGAKFSPARTGAGRIDLQDASSSEVVAFSDDDAGAVSVSFGTPEVVGSGTLIRTARVVNKGTADAAYDLAYVGLSDLPGVDYSFPDGASVTVPANGSATFRIQLSADAALMRHPLDPTMSTVQGNPPNPRHYMSEESGYVTLTPSSGTSLRLPVYAAPRPASAMTTEHNYVLLTGPTGSTAVTLDGQGLDTGIFFPQDVLSLATAFELHENSPANIPAASPARNADLKAVGVTSDFKATNSVNPNTKIFFAVATHGQWSTPSDVTFNIFIDRDMNGTDDFQIVNTAFTDPQGNNFDVFVSARRGLAPVTGLVADSFINNFSGGVLETVPYNTNVMVIPVSASALGLTTANAKFRYRVTTASRGFGGTIDSMTARTYDAANPGFDVTGGIPGMPFYRDLDGVSVPVNYNKANLLANGTLGLLLVHFHNALGAHDQTLAIREPTATAVAVDAASGQYSDPVTLKATVSPATHLDQIVAGSVQFSVDGNPVGLPVAVDSAGVATTTYTIAVPAGPHAVTAAFTSANPAFLGSSNTGALAVSREDADASPSASNATAVKVNSPGGTAGPVNLCFDIAEVGDGSAGDTSNITSVSAVLTPVGGGSPVTAGASTFSGGGVGAARTACVTPTNVPVNIYDVLLTINGDYYQGSGATVLVVYDPSLGFVTGGGHIVRGGFTANFGLNFKYHKNGKPQGSLVYVEHRPGGDVVVKSAAMSGLAVVGSEAIPTGKAVVNGVGNYGFIARVIDNGEPGANDLFGLRVIDPDGNVVADLTFDPVQLSGGNVQVPKQAGK